MEAGFERAPHDPYVDYLYFDHVLTSKEEKATDTHLMVNLNKRLVCMYKQNFINFRPKPKKWHSFHPVAGEIRFRKTSPYI